MDNERKALAGRPFTDEQLAKTLQVFRRELDKNMELSNSSHSPGHDAMRVALDWLFADITRDTEQVNAEQTHVRVPVEQLEHWAEYWNGSANEEAMSDALEHILGEVSDLLRASSGKESEHGK